MRRSRFRLTKSPQTRELDAATSRQEQEQLRAPGSSSVPGSSCSSSSSPKSLRVLVAQEVQVAVTTLGGSIYFANDAGSIRVGAESTDSDNLTKAVDRRLSELQYRVPLRFSFDGAPRGACLERRERAGDQQRISVQRSGAFFAPL
ncbi:unnamed protein product [Amoebophrya sp. A25]|nr:unnamed protein product [Amoebophrya sp. A25]|eukprot:GSA25T00000179001.1